jgi:hypothetical protein
MTPDERCETFVRALTLLDVDDDGLTDNNNLDDLEAIAQICPDVKNITSPGDSPYALALHRLAVLTEDLLVTYVFPDRQVVRGWLIARAELLDLRLAANG